MDVFLQIALSGATLGAMYAVGAVGLSLIWGAMGVLNMAHGAMMTLGGYASFAAVSALGLPAWMGLPAAILAGFVIGALIYALVVRQMFRHPAFETNIIIATVGLAMLLESLVLKGFGAYPSKQPFMIEGGFRISEVFIPYQNLMIVAIAVLLMVVVSWILERTRVGRAIRATAQDRDAAQLMGVPVGRVFAQVLGIAGAVVAVSGVMLSSIATLTPTMGYDPMLKAFIVCVVAGLGRVNGALIAAFAIGLFEAVVQYYAGVRFGFPAMLILVIAVLIWRPNGLFGRAQATRI